jgi:hypothetical protein
MATHTVKKLYTCYICKKAFSFKQTLTRHNLTILGAIDKTNIENQKRLIHTPDYSYKINESIKHFSSN